MKKQKLLAAIATVAMCASSFFALPACHSHKYTWTKVQDPTCSAVGKEEGVCSCGDKTTRDIAINPDAHNYGEWAVTAPTASATGTAVKTCAHNSAHKVEVTLPKTDDASYTTKTDKAATVYSTGVKSYKLANDNGAIEFSETTPMLPIATLEDAVTAGTNLKGLVRSGSGTVYSANGKDPEFEYVYGDNLTYVFDGDDYMKYWVSSDADGNITAIFSNYNYDTKEYDNYMLGEATADKVEEMGGSPYEGFAYRLGYTFANVHSYGTEAFLKTLFGYYSNNANGDAVGTVTNNDDGTTSGTFSFGYYNSEYYYHCLVTVDFTLTANRSVASLVATSKCFYMSVANVYKNVGAGNGSYTYTSNSFVYYQQVGEGEGDYIYNWMTDTAEYVGAGNGTHIKIEETNDDYEFVGEGLGEYEMEEVTVYEDNEDGTFTFSEDVGLVGTDNYIMEKISVTQTEKADGDTQPVCPVDLGSVRLNELKLSTLVTDATTQETTVGAAITDTTVIEAVAAEPVYALLTDIPETYDENLDPLKVYMLEDGEEVELSYFGGKANVDFEMLSDEAAEAQGLPAHSAKLMVKFLTSGDVTLKIKTHNVTKTVNFTVAKCAPDSLVSSAYTYNEKTNAYEATKTGSVSIYVGQTVDVFASAVKDYMDGSYTATVSTGATITDVTVDGVAAKKVTAAAAGEYTVTFTSTVDTGLSATLTVNVLPVPEAGSLLNGEWECKAAGLSVVFTPASAGAASGSVVVTKTTGTSTVTETLDYSYADGAITVTHKSGDTLGYTFEFNAKYHLVLVGKDSVGEDVRNLCTVPSAGGVVGTYSAYHKFNDYFSLSFKLVLNDDGTGVLYHLQKNWMDEVEEIPHYFNYAFDGDHFTFSATTDPDLIASNMVSDNMYSDYLSGKVYDEVEWVYRTGDYAAANAGSYIDTEGNIVLKLDVEEGTLFTFTAAE